MNVSYKKTKQGYQSLAALLLIATTQLPTSAFAQKKVTAPADEEASGAKTSAVENTPSEASSSEGSMGEAVDVNSIKKKYWATGEEANMGVVQNRLFTKSGKIDIGVMGGVVSADPFLSIKTYGLTAGYHINEYYGVNLIALQYLVGKSNALTTLEEGGKRASTNTPYNFIGIEGTGSFLYGKLSLVGKRIIYYDMHVAAGAGYQTSETQKFAKQQNETLIPISPLLGVGQRFYLTRSLSLRVDYRLIVTQEAVIEKEVLATLNDVIGKRWNFQHTITMGLSFMFGVRKK